MSLKCQAVIDRIKEKVAAADPNPANRKVLLVFDMKITQDGKQVKQFTMDLKKLEFYEGGYSGSADVTVCIDDMAFVQLAKKELTREDAIKQGKLKLDGAPEALAKMAFLDAKLKE